ncbi:MAG: type II toxin-antitoxin system HicB family antitoxin [Bauldia sp.]
MRYSALIDGRAGAYGVVFPDLPGCAAMGKTIDQALNNAADALRDWVELTEESGEAVPPPRPVDRLRRDPDVAAALAEGALLAAVPLLRETGKPVKANLSIDSGLLATLDDEAKHRELTRSGMVEWMVKTMLRDLA